MDRVETNIGPIEIPQNKLEELTGKAKASTQRGAAFRAISTRRFSLNAAARAGAEAFLFLAGSTLRDPDRV